MEKQLKKIVDELQLIRKELQKSNNRSRDVVQGVTTMQIGEPIFSNEEMIKRVADKMTERLQHL